MKSQNPDKPLLFSSILLIFFWSGISAQENKTDTGYVPEVGQQGKDVVWVPTPTELVNAMLKLAKVTADDYVIDLGSGDGRTVIAAAKIGAHAIGIEYNPDMVALVQKKCRAGRREQDNRIHRNRSL